MSEYNEYFAANKAHWNQRTLVHKDSGFYNRAGFLKGEGVLTPIERGELTNVSGKKMLHLQCHFGMDSLDWARQGAIVTGVDISDEAIKEAQQLNKELGLDARFICCNIYDLKSQLDEAASFDIVFTTYGTVGWLPDLEPWAALIAHYLKPGGRFYFAEFHPVLWMFDDDFTRIQYAYDKQEVIVTENQGTYTDRKADIQGKEYSWNHSISEVLNALLKAGLKLENFNEHMYSPYPCFRNMKETSPGRWEIAGMEGKLPMVYSLLAVKQ